MPVPAEFEEDYQRYRKERIEKIVETDEQLLIRYLEGEELSSEDLHYALRRATVDQTLVPVLCGSAISGKGIHPS